MLPRESFDLSHTRLLHIVNIFVSGDGTPAKTAVLNRVSQRLPAPWLYLRFD